MTFLKGKGYQYGGVSVTYMGPIYNEGKNYIKQRVFAKEVTTFTGPEILKLEEKKYKNLLKKQEHLFRVGIYLLLNYYLHCHVCFN